MLFGDIIRETRARLNLTRAELAKKCGLKYSTLKNYECNYRTPDIEATKKLADALGVTLDYLTCFNRTHPQGRSKFPLYKEIHSKDDLSKSKKIECYLYGNSEDEGNYFYYKVTDDNLSGLRILSGDIVFVKEQDFASSGNIALVSVKEQRAVLRMIVVTKTGLFVQSTAKDEIPFFVSSAELKATPTLLQIFGVAKQLVVNL